MTGSFIHGMPRLFLNFKPVQQRVLGAVLLKDFYIKRTQVLSPDMYREVQNPKPCQKLPYYISSRNKHKKKKKEKETNTKTNKH